MSIREVESQYVGSLLGFVWTFINPMMMVFVFWFVFSVGFKSPTINDVPFVAWLVPGLAAWNFFSEAISSSSEVLVHNSPLIKKTLFKSQVLPLVRVVSSLIHHFIFLIIVFFLLFFLDIPITIYWIQIFYYLIATIFLVSGISFIASSLTVFVKDVSKIISLILQLGFWATPVFWNLQIMPEKVQRLMIYNPMYYIVRGYRDSLIYNIPFWNYKEETFYFWTLSFCIFFVGAFIFKRLQPHFVDVL